MDGEIPEQAGNNHPQSIPTGVFATSDGNINIAVAGEQIWQRFADVLDKPKWKNDERFLNNDARSKNRDMLNAEIEAITITNSTTYWVSTLNKAGIPAGEINNIAQVFNNAQVRHLGLAQGVTSHERGTTELVGQPIIMSRTPSKIMSPSPLSGAHSEDILKALNYSKHQIEMLRKDGVI